MRRNCNDRHLAFLGPIAPEDVMGGGRVLLGVGFKDLLGWMVGVFNGRVRMRLQRRMLGIVL